MTTKWSDERFAGGSLATVMAETMLGEKQRPRFTKLAGKPRDDAARAAFAAYFGWTPPAELGEWSAVENAYAKVFELVSDVWMLQSSPLGLGKKTPPVAKAINDADFVFTLLTGLRAFGADPSGDSCFVSTLPSASDLGAVYVFNHENGELDGDHAASIASFVASNFSPQRDEEDEEDDEPPWRSVARRLNARWKKSAAKHAAQSSPEQLFERAKWLFELPTGETGYAFAERLGDAPTFATWTKERALLSKHPVLANYWMLAHYFLGNADACREAVASAAKCAGRVTPELAAMIAALLDDPRARLGSLTPETLGELREATAKNCDPAQLDPRVAKTVAKERAPATKTLTPEEIQARLAKGDDGFALIAEYPDDVASHDLILKTMSKGDKELTRTVDDYMRERTDSPYSTWPYRKKDYDARFTVAVSAAFRSGLRYDADHKLSYAALANTLAHADDDVAMNAFDAAMEKLDGADDRLGYVIEALRKSAHARAPDVLERGAHRFFATLDAAAKRLAKKDKQGPTLDNMFSVETHFVQALHILLRRRDERARALAQKTLGYTTNLRLFGTCVGHAMRVAVQFGDRACVANAHGYLEAALGYWETTDYTHDYVVLNATEAAIALAKLEPEKAEAVLRAGFDRKREHLDADLAARAAMLAGLLILHPDEPALLEWLERLLGDRSGAMRVYAGLRAVEECKIARAKPWVLPHRYGRRTSLSGTQTGFWLFAETARDALAALGEERAPPFDDTDEYGTHLKNEELAAALSHPERHHISNIFQKIREKKVISPDVIRASRDVLVDLYRWSGDEHGAVSAADNARVEGVRALFLQGPAAAETFGELIELPHLADDDRTFLTVVQRLCGQELAVRTWLATASKDDVTSEIAKPRRAFHGFVDLFAARAMVLGGGADVERAITAALEERIAASNGLSGNDLVLLHLGYVGAHVAEARKAIEGIKPERPNSYYIHEPLTRALALPKVDVDHDFAKPIALTARFGMEGYSEDCRPTNHLTLGVRDACVTWESSGSGYTLGLQGVFDDAGSRGGFRFGGEIPCASPAAAKARAQEELRAALLLGYRVPAPRAAKKKKK